VTRLVREGGKPLIQVARGLGISRSALYKWLREQDADQAKPVVQDTKEVQALKKKLRRTEEELEILKKAVAFFAQQGGKER